MYKLLIIGMALPLLALSCSRGALKPSSPAPPAASAPSSDLQSEAQDEISGSTYTNTRFGFSFTIPEGWHFASNSTALVRDSFLGMVLVTSAGRSVESAYEEKLKNFAGPGDAFDHVTDLDGKIIAIAPSTISADQLLHPDAGEGFRQSDYRETKYSSGTVVYVRQQYTGDLNRDLDLAYIPYTGTATVQDQKISYIALQIQRAPGYDRGAFEKIVSSFTFRK